MVDSMLEERPGVFRLVLSSAAASEASPGQFLMMEVSSGRFPVTRRPFTVSRTDRSRGTAEIVFQVVGAGTRALASLVPGDPVRTLGPLGRGFRLGARRWLLVGGGLGAAGLPLLAERVPSATVCIGASCADRVLSGGLDAVVATEDGSAGRRGLVTDLLEGTDWDSYDAVAVCGPAAMIRAVVEAVPPERLADVQVSMESRMGCGWGACSGCAVPAAGGGFVKCCIDGPVFGAAELDWMRIDGSLT